MVNSQQESEVSNRLSSGALNNFFNARGAAAGTGQVNSVSTRANLSTANNNIKNALIGQSSGGVVGVQDRGGIQ